MGRTGGAQGEEGGEERVEEGRTGFIVARAQVEPSLEGWGGVGSMGLEGGASKGTRHKPPKGPLGLKLSSKPGLL